MKPPTEIYTYADLKKYLSFFVEGSWGLWIDRRGYVNVVVPKHQHVELSIDLNKRLVTGGVIIVRPSGFVNELRLLWIRFKERFQNVRQKRISKNQG
jgi:hypothetical protein